MGDAGAVHRWEVFEGAVEVPLDGRDPLRDLAAVAELSGPSGTFLVPGFWDGDATWRVRFAPDAVGTWRYRIAVTARHPAANGQGQPGAAGAAAGSFVCTPYAGTNPLYVNGPIRRSRDGRHLEHQNGTPFFWLADTVWNGPMLATAEAWAYFVETRRSQGFTAAQYVATSWRTAPDGGPDGPTYTTTADGRLSAVNPAFFRRLDARLRALAEAGLVGAPVLLWAIARGEGAQTNPGNALSEADCVLLARYQIARWQAWPVCWILNGDGRYSGENAPRWQRIGRAVFAAPAQAPERAPVITHPGGQHWVGAEFGAEPWLDVIGYQSGHGDDAHAWRWIVEGPPATEWPNVPGKTVLNLEPCYEDHLAYQSRTRISADDVRRACYWSVLVSPPAGVTYGGHGVWGWDDGTAPPVAHPTTGLPKPWREALHLPGARQMRYLADCFTGLPWWTLRPDRSLLDAQPGERDVTHYVTAARSEDGRSIVAYLPAGDAIRLRAAVLPCGARATWLNPRDGSRAPATLTVSGDVASCRAPDAHDWVLLVEAGRDPPLDARDAP